MRGPEHSRVLDAQGDLLWVRKMSQSTSDFSHFNHRDIVFSVFHRKATQHFQPKEPVEYLSRQETAELLKVDLSTIHNWTKQNKLVAYSIGARVYYKRKEVENAIVKLER